MSRSWLPSNQHPNRFLALGRINHIHDDRDGASKGPFDATNLRDHFRNPRCIAALPWNHQSVGTALGDTFDPTCLEMLTAHRDAESSLPLHEGIRSVSGRSRYCTKLSVVLLSVILTTSHEVNEGRQRNVVDALTGSTHELKEMLPFPDQCEPPPGPLGDRQRRVLVTADNLENNRLSQGTASI